MPRHGRSPWRKFPQAPGRLIDRAASRDARHRDDAVTRDERSQSPPATFVNDHGRNVRFGRQRACSFKMLTAALSQERSLRRLDDHIGDGEQRPRDGDRNV
jgi:hypothetical protein